MADQTLKTKRDFRKDMAERAEFPIVNTPITKNPATQMVTENPALSIPYIKYYTSLLEEYIHIRSIGGSDTASAIKQAMKEDGDAVFPSYLTYKPYYSMSPFPTMKLYRSNQEIVTNKDDDGNINPVRNSASDIILTYRSAPSRNSSLKDRSITNLFTSQGGELASSLLLEFAKDGNLGSSPVIRSHIEKYIYSTYDKVVSKAEDITEIQKTTPKERKSSNKNAYPMLAYIFRNIGINYVRNIEYLIQVENYGLYEPLHPTVGGPDKISILHNVHVIKERIDEWINSYATGISNEDIVELKADVGKIINKYFELPKGESGWAKWIFSQTNPYIRENLQNIAADVRGEKIHTENIPDQKVKPLEAKYTKEHIAFDSTSHMIKNELLPLLRYKFNSAGLELVRILDYHITDAGPPMVNGISFGNVKEGAEILSDEGVFNSSPAINELLTNIKNADSIKTIVEYQKLTEPFDFPTNIDQTILDDIKAQGYEITQSGTPSTYTFSYTTSNGNKITISNSKGQWYSFLIMACFLAGKKQTKQNRPLRSYIADINPDWDTIVGLYNGGKYQSNGELIANQQSYVNSIRNIEEGELNNAFKDLGLTPDLFAESRYEYTLKAARNTAGNLRKDITDQFSLIQRNIAAGSLTKNSEAYQLLNFLHEELKRLESRLDDLYEAETKDILNNISYLQIEGKVIVYTLDSLIRIAENFLKSSTVTRSGNTRSTIIVLELLKAIKSILSGVVGFDPKEVEVTVINQSNIENRRAFDDVVKRYLLNNSDNIRRFVSHDTASEIEQMNEFYIDRVIPEYGVHLENIFKYIRSLFYIVKENNDNLDIELINLGGGGTRTGPLPSDMVALVTDVIVGDAETRRKLVAEANKRAEGSSVSDTEYIILGQRVATSEEIRLYPVSLSELDLNFEKTDNTLESATYKDAIIYANRGVMSLTSMFRRTIRNDIIRFKNLKINNTESKDGLISTTINKYEVLVGSSVIPIFLDGREHPVIQNFGGSKPAINISLVTNDPFLLDDITAACGELDITMRTRNELKNVSPLSPALGSLDKNTQNNSLVYNLTRKNVMKRITNLAKGGQNRLLEGSVSDAPILITNNVANMMGVYGVVLKQATVTHMEGFPNAFQIDLNFIGVDISQEFRETPRKRLSIADPSFIIGDLCRIPISTFNTFFGDNEGANIKFQISNTQASINNILSQWIVLNYMRHILRNDASRLGITGENGIKERGLRYADSDDIYVRFAELSANMIIVFMNDVIAPILREIANTEYITEGEMNRIIKKYARTVVDDLNLAMGKSGDKAGKYKVIVKYWRDTIDTTETSRKLGEAFSPITPSLSASSFRPEDIESEISLRSLLINPPALSTINGNQLVTTKVNVINVDSPSSKTNINQSSAAQRHSTVMAMNYILRDFITNIGKWPSHNIDKMTLRLKNTGEGSIKINNIEGGPKSDELTTENNAWLSQFDLTAAVMQETWKVFGLLQKLGNKDISSSRGEIIKQTILSYLGMNKNANLDMFADMFNGFAVQCFKEIHKLNFFDNVIDKKQEIDKDPFGNIPIDSNPLYELNKIISGNPAVLRPVISDIINGNQIPADVDPTIAFIHLLFFNNNSATTGLKQALRLFFSADFLSGAMNDLYGLKVIRNRYIDGLTEEGRSESESRASRNVGTLLEYCDLISLFIERGEIQEVFGRRMIKKAIAVYEVEHPKTMKELIHTDINLISFGTGDILTHVQQQILKSDGAAQLLRKQLQLTESESFSPIMDSSVKTATDEADELYEKLGLVFAPSKQTLRKSSMVIYRIVDSISKYIVMPTMQEIDSKISSSGADSISSSNIAEFISRMANKKIYNRDSKVNSNIDGMDPVFGTSPTSILISPKTFRLLALLMPINRTVYYDLYNAYPDRPLPVFGYRTNVEDVRSKTLSALQMFTTPDFFIRRDTEYLDMIVDDITSKIDAASTVIQAETEVGYREDEGTLASYKRKFQQIAEIAEKTGVDKTIELQTTTANMLQELTFGLWTEDKESFKDRMAANSDWILLTSRAGGSDFSDEYYKALLPIHNASVGGGETSISNGVFKAFQELNSMNTRKRESLNTEFQINRKLEILHRESLDAEGILTKIGEIEEARLQMIAASKAKKSDANIISNRQIDLVKSLINPSAAAYNSMSINTMREKLNRYKIKSRQVMPVSSMAMSFPTFKLYIIEEDAKEWLFFNDFYDYGAVKQIRINKNRKTATDTAYIELTNIYGRLTNFLASTRTKTENPFYVRPSDEEKVNSMYLREGARIQVRLGYNAMLGSESVVFSGRIQEITGTTDIMLVAQSHGVELTREIGTGAGVSFGFLNRLQIPFTGRQIGIHNTNNSLGLIAAIMDQSGSPLRGIGTLSPFLGNARARTISYNEPIPGLEENRILKDGFLGWGMRWLRSSFTKSLAGFDPTLMDTRLTNVNVDSDSKHFISTLFGRSRWLILNETIWDSLQDYTLQLGNRICTVRNFDEDNTIVIDNDDGVYQRSMENYIRSGALMPIINELQKGEKSAVHAIDIFRKMLSYEDRITGRNNEEGVEVHTPIRDICTFGIKNTLLSLLSSGQLSERELSGRTANEGIADTTSRIVSKILGGKINTMLDIAEKYDNATSQSLMEFHKRILKQLPADSESKRKYQEKLDEDDRANTKEDTGRTATPIDVLDGFIASQAACKISKFIKHYIAAGEKSFRSVSDIHIKTAAKDIIKNNIKVVSGFNRVDLSYLDEDFMGSALSIVGFGDIGSMLGLGNSISLDRINTPSARRNTYVKASTTIEFDKVNTYASFQKNAAVRGAILVDNPLIVANGILANLVRDYYDGELIMLMDPTIEIFDVIFIHDDLNDMWGMIQVKEVTHSFSHETGAVTVIKPDVYVRVNIEAERRTYDVLSTKGLVNIMQNSISLAGFLVAWGLGGRILRAGTKFLGKVFPKIGSTLTGRATRGVRMYVQKVATGGSKKQARRLLGEVDDIFSSKKVNNALRNLSRPDALLGRLRSQARQFFKKGAQQPTVNINSVRKFYTQFADDLIRVADGLENKTTANAIKRALGRARKRVRDTSSYGDFIDDITTELKNKGQIESMGDDLANVVEKYFQTAHSGDSLIVHSVLEDGFSSIGANALFSPSSRGLANMFNVFNFGTAMKQIIGAGLSVKIGRAILPNLNPFVAHVGEFLNQNPIVISGLVHKGEPLISNLDGMSRRQFGSFIDWMDYKVGEAFNPLYTLIGDVEETLYGIENSPFSDFF